MRIVALFAVRNEERFIGNAIGYLAAQGIESYVIDNESTDRTREIVESLRGGGVIGVETLAYPGAFPWGALLRRKEQLHCELGAHWYIHHDADIVLQAPPPYRSLAEGIAAVDRAGDNAVNFDEFCFMPTGPDDDHDNDRYLDEMRRYFYFAPMPQFRVIAWKNQGKRIWIDGGGHWASFHGRRIHPQPFIMRHYLALSPAHAVRKYCDRSFLKSEIRLGWHDKRAMLRPEAIAYPPTEVLRTVSDDNTWDRSCPLCEEPLFAKTPRPPAALPPYLIWAKEFLRRRAQGLARRFPSVRLTLRSGVAGDQRVSLLPPRDEQRPVHNVLLLGSGRSGTSMVAALFRNSGYFMGFDMLEGSQANPYGYYEDTGITEINNLLLRWMLPWWLVRLLPGLAPAVHRDPRALWLAAPRRLRTAGALMLPLARLMEAYARQQPFCYKDPRFSVTLPLWERFLPFGTRRIVVFRDPDQTVDSILRDARETYSPPLPVSIRWAYTSWYRNYARLLDTVDAGGAAIFVHYDGIASGRALPMISAFTNATIDATQVDPTVGRSTALEHRLPIAARCRELYARLCERASADIQRIGNEVGARPERPPAGDRGLEAGGRPAGGSQPLPV